MKGIRNIRVRRFVLAFLALLGLIVFGTIGFHAFGERWIPSFYRAVVSVSLTGLDSKPASEGAQVFTIVLLLLGVAIFLYVAGAIAEAIARGLVTGAWQERRRRLTIEAMRNHFIICGYGRVGRRAAREFRESGVPYVVVDFHEDALEAARRTGDILVEGSGTEDVNLIAAGIERARGLVASADSDVDNLYITLSARAVRPDLLIVARASDDDAAKKLRMAGANRIVQPYSTAGLEMAKLVLKPQVAAYLDVAGAGGSDEIQFEEIVVTPGCLHMGETIGELRVRDVTGAMIIAVRKADGSFDTTPSPALPLEAGDIIIGVGKPAELRALEELFTPDEQERR
ncbi:MAG: potassium channel protein [Gaiellaceae bacterium]|jgi:voltage-gated potassium channel